MVIRVVVYFTAVLQQHTLIPVVFCLRVVIYLCFNVFFLMIDLNLLLHVFELMTEKEARLSVMGLELGLLFSPFI